MDEELRKRFMPFAIEGDSSGYYPAVILCLASNDGKGYGGVASFWFPLLEQACTDREREEIEKHLRRLSHVVYPIVVREFAKRK